MSKPSRADPVLLEQLARAKGDEPVSAVFTLRTARRTAKPEDPDAFVRRLIGEAERGSGCRAGELAVFRNLRSFAVSGPAPLIRRLLDCAHVETATANVRDESLLIRPVERKPARLDDGEG